MEIRKEDKLKLIAGYVPKGQSPRLYWELLKSQVMGTDRSGQPRSDDVTLYFLYICNRTGLDPIARQIYPVFYWDSKVGKDKMSIQVGIDGMRLVAERSGKYAGQSDVVFESEKVGDKNPVKATVTVYKMMNYQKIDTVATARWSEYAQYTSDGKAKGLWGKMPFLMLGKCAEALALRKAFPNELSGIYLTEEMPAQNNTVDEILSKLPDPKEVKKEDAPNIATANIDLSALRKNNKK